jgi:hypothetical protein
MNILKFWRESRPYRPNMRVLLDHLLSDQCPFHETPDQALSALIIQRVIRYVEVSQIALANDLLPPFEGGTPDPVS